MNASELAEVLVHAWLFGALVTALFVRDVERAFFRRAFLWPIYWSYLAARFCRDRRHT